MSLDRKQKNLSATLDEHTVRPRDSEESSPLRIAICGTRGIPACYGGFETFAEELASRLALRGHQVTVYGRRHVIDYDQPTYRGAKIKLLPAPQHKYLETPVHGLLSFLDLLRDPVDVVLVCNAANSPFVWIPRLRKMPVIVNVDGIERQRRKWNALGRCWYRIGELCSVCFASEIVADAEIIREYYRSTYRSSSELIRYGYRERFPEKVAAKVDSGEPITYSPSETEIFRELGVQPDRYLLYVSRLEPENNAHLVIEAYQRLVGEEASMPLVIVGDAPYAHEYIQGLRAKAGPRVVFAGFRFGEAYELLQVGARLYVQATEVGGTHPALVEAMGFANCIIANDTPEHREVLGEAGLIYKKNDPEHLADLMMRCLSSADEVSAHRRAALTRARELFAWERIVDDYEKLFGVLSPPGRKAARRLKTQKP